MKKKTFNKPSSSGFKPVSREKPGSIIKKFEPKPDEGIRLNKYISNAGICSRRKADELIQNGEITVNGVVVTEMGHKVFAKDLIKHNGKKVVSDKKIYILFNKPKDCITTTSDEKGRKTVLDYIKESDRTRLYPVGRLDRNTTGLLVLTNDGDLAQNLAHPSNAIPKLYEAQLDKNLSLPDLEKIRAGVTLEDGVANVDAVEYSGGDKRTIGIQIHIGKNRIVRRIFEHLGYQVVKLDRITYAGLTKKDLPRGKYRNLTEKEIVFLKYFTGKNANNKKGKPQP